MAIEEIPFEDSFGSRKAELREWEDILATARQNSRGDHDYYDGKQWTQEEVDNLKARGQAAIVFNRVAPKIDFMLGTEIEARKKPRAYPRTAYDEGDADSVTDGLRYVADEDDFEGKFTAGATSAIIDGTGGIVVRTDADDIEDATEIISEDVPFDRLFFDPRARKPDGSDARYKGIIAWKDIDEVRARWPAAAEAIDASMSVEVTLIEGQDSRFRWYNKKTKEIQIVEHYYQGLDPGTGLPEWYECWWVGGGYLEEPRRVQYLDDKNPQRTWCPLTICSPYITGGNSEVPERHGPIRRMRGPQDEINHRRSKAIHQLHTKKIYYETGALVDPEGTRAELMKANPFIELARGRLKEGFRVEENTDLAAAQVQMLMEAKDEIAQTGPQPIPPQASGGQKMSGRLYIAQQETGAMEMRPVFDALRRWAISIFKRYYWLMRQTWTEEDWFIVTDDETEDGYRLVGINRMMSRGERLEEAIEEGTELKKAVRYAYGMDGRKLLREATKIVKAQVQQAQARAKAANQPPQPVPPEQVQQTIVEILLGAEISGEIVKANDIGRTNVNIIIETSPNSVLAQHEQFLELAGMIKDGLFAGQDPKTLMRILIEASSLMKKRKLLAMLDKPPDPAQVQAQQQAQQLQQAQMQKQIELLSAQVANLMAQSQKSQAQAALAASKVQTEPSVGILRQAQAQKAVAEAQTEMHDGNLKQAQTLKTAHEAGQASVTTGE